MIRHSLELRNKELPQQSAKAVELKRELESLTVSSPTPSGSSYISLQPFKYTHGEGRDGTGGGTTPSSSTSSLPLGKSAAITGKLEVRLMGCQDLLEDVPGRSRRDSTHSAPNDLKSFVKGMQTSSRTSIDDFSFRQVMSVSENLDGTQEFGLDGVRWFYK